MLLWMRIQSGAECAQQHAGPHLSSLFGSGVPVNCHLGPVAVKVYLNYA